MEIIHSLHCLHCISSVKLFNKSAKIIKYGFHLNLYNNKMMDNDNDETTKFM